MEKAAKVGKPSELRGHADSGQHPVPILREKTTHPPHFREQHRPCRARRVRRFFWEKNDSATFPFRWHRCSRHGRCFWCAAFPLRVLRALSDPPEPLFPPPMSLFPNDPPVSPLHSREKAIASPRAAGGGDFPFGRNTAAHLTHHHHLAQSTQLHPLHLQRVHARRQALARHREAR